MFFILYYSKIQNDNIFFCRGGSVANNISGLNRYTRVFVWNRMLRQEVLPGMNNQNDESAYVLGDMKKRITKRLCTIHGRMYVDIKP